MGPWGPAQSVDTAKVMKKVEKIRREALTFYDNRTQKYREVGGLHPESVKTHGAFEYQNNQERGSAER